MKTATIITAVSTLKKTCSVRLWTCGCSWVVRTSFVAISSPSLIRKTHWTQVHTTTHRELLAKNRRYTHRSVEDRIPADEKPLPRTPSKAIGQKCRSHHLCRTDHSFRFRKRRALVITDTELKLMAAAAKMGLSSRPKTG